jgi:glucokinase
MGGTNLRGARVQPGQAIRLQTLSVNSGGTESEVLGQLFSVVENLLTPEVKGIGLGVPSVVDLSSGTVYDVQNIPSWKEVPLKNLLEDRFSLPVQVNNDANCFALGEYYFGQAKGSAAFIGLTIGTGLGAGLILNGKLFAGPNGGAGEVGMLPYRDKVLEYYASGQFFRNVYGTNGKEVFAAALRGDPMALEQFSELGRHLGQAFTALLYAYDPDRIVIGGSVAAAWPLLEPSVTQALRTFAFPRSVQRLRISVSELENAGVLGAAALLWDAGFVSG